MRQKKTERNVNFACFKLNGTLLQSHKNECISAQTRRISPTQPQIDCQMTVCENKMLLHTQPCQRIRCYDGQKGVFQMYVACALSASLFPSYHTAQCLWCMHRCIHHHKQLSVSESV